VPTALSDIRIARSFIGHTSAANVEQTQVLDFDLGVQEAIQIFGVFGTMLPNVAAATGTFHNLATQTLHLEDDTLAEIPVDDADADLFESDSEVVYQQELGMIFYNGTTEAAGSSYINPSGLFTFIDPILAAANLTHRTESNTTDMDLAASMFIHYRYVRLNTNELAFAIARRGR
jgi:hypothetical protein